MGIARMGNLCSCLPQNPQKPVNNRRKPTKPSSSVPRLTQSSRKTNEFLIHEQALAAAMLYQHHHRNATLPFDRSVSLRNPHSSSKKITIPRSSSSRARSLTDPLLPPDHLIPNNQEKLDDLETIHFVLVHGGGFGAWCWYKTIALLEEVGYKVSAIELNGSGTHLFDTNKVTSLSQYVQPLIKFLQMLDDTEKVILVGHDLGGACISYAMELFPLKISKAVFVAAAMLSNGQTALDMLSPQAGSSDLLRKAQVFLYGNGINQPPTAIELQKSLLRELLFNQSSTKDIALASVSLRPIPFSPILEKISLTDMNYGSVRRFYIETAEDNAIPIELQESMVKSCPPAKVFHLKNADHCPFFSKPQALHKLLVEISKISAT